MKRTDVCLSTSALVVAASLFAFFVLGVSTASAITFDRRGRATLDAAYGEGFEDDLKDDQYLGTTKPTYTDEAPLQGSRSLVVGAENPSRILTLPESEFEGRRVNIRLWYRAQGTDLSPRLYWSNRDPGFGGVGNGAALGNVALHRTGRATTDGWVEVETGPIDWEFAEAGAPTALILTDTQYARRRPLGRDSSLTVQVDALEIQDLGEAKVPSADCNLGNETQKCGDRGVCMLGKCVDGAAALGTLPRPSVREEYLERRSFLIEATLAVRRTRSKLEEFQSNLEFLRATNAKGSWGEIVESWELLRDGHGRPPTGRVLQARGLDGVCLGPGQADLLKDAPAAPVPMVFETGSGQLKKGDVLTSIDGMTVEKWRERAARYLYYNGDPSGREALTVNDVLRAAVVAGSTVEFTRCERPKSQLDQPCSASEATTVTIDYGEKVGDAVWQGERASDFFERRQICDFRFDGLRPETQRVRRGDAFFDETSDGIVRAEFYNMPRPRRDGNGDFSPWRAKWEDAMSDEPERVLVDQRRGFGGSFTATHYLGSLFLDGFRSVNEVGVPWFGVELTDQMVSALRECASQTRSRRACSGIFSNRIQDRLPTDLGAKSKLALISARAVSGHDFYAKYMTFRDAETRFFGYSPTIGGFGEFRQFAPVPGEIQPPTYQFHDTRFFDGDGDFSGSRFSSGRGVGPDEVVYQKQSDALVDVDTVIESAKEWLRGSN